MQTFSPGQRWISEAEPDLGLGLVVEADERSVRVAFLSCDDERTYASNNAPLSRVILRTGERTRHGEGWSFTVEQVAEEEGLVAYLGRRDDGETVAIPETQLAHDIQINAPRDRLLTNQLDRHSAFSLRYETLRQRARLEQSPLRGLLGARVAPLPHQLYIASEVVSRPAPRVLLADEVGLGKTIEAGLILHHQWLTERARRVLIVVPEALVSQWLLELMRRFNLAAAHLDEERCQAATEATGDNPFASEQLVVCSLDFLMNHPERAEQALALDWDIAVVDEAHHLGWRPEAASPEYRWVEQLATQVPGLLLLTATPEQLGREGHFARLRLLDPARYDDLDAFIAEEARYAEAADGVEWLLEGKALSGEQRRKLEALYPELPDDKALADEDTRQRAVRELIDRHGTGRVLFRNTRQHIGQWIDFPERRLHSYPQPDETACEDWLVEWLKSHNDKALVICHSAERAVALEQRLQLREGILCAAFHEGMSLLARDRAAAWFGEDMGARVLLCSEIGSEGRNFQFAHHLVLMDLPDQPDLLEQRIGRLDRIGQRHAVDIHVPFVEDSRESVLLQWYDEGLDAFAAPCPAAGVLRQQLAEDLDSAMEQPGDDIALATLLEHTQSELKTLNEAMERGRDRLLEHSACDWQRAEPLVRAMEEQSGDEATAVLQDYLEQVCDNFGVDFEALDADTALLRPGQHYRGGLRDLGDEGRSVTWHRNHALAREDLAFVTWEHPIVTDAMDDVAGSNLGTACVGTLEQSGLPEGQLLVECLFRIHSVAPRSLELGRYLPPQLFRLVVDHQQRHLSKQLPFDKVDWTVGKVKRETAKQVIEQQRGTLETMMDRAAALADGALPPAIDRALERIQRELVPELDRLKALKKANASVRDEEIALLEEKIEAARQATQSAQLKMEGVRVLITV
ncbi:MAG: RNA polymerase-associated protein RapA [Pseudomonadota bacterium]